MAEVELEALTKRFGEAVALDGLTLSIAHGSLVCLLGSVGLRQDHDIAARRRLYGP